MVRALDLRGVCRMQAGDAAGALEDFEAIIARDPRHSMARMNRGILRAQAGRLDEAGEDLDAAVRLDPLEPKALSNRGYLRFLRGDAAGAVADYRAGAALCESKGIDGAWRGETVLAFRKRIFDALLKSGNREGARAEIDAIRALASPAALQAAAELERLGSDGGIR
jgi:tetratricopeptide (TPR) repeat protein